MLLNVDVEIIEEFLKDYFVELTGSVISKKKNLPQKTVANHLLKLENEGILKSKILGRNKIYFLNFEDFEIVKNFILAVEHLRTIRFFKKEVLLKEIVERINKHIYGSAVIFGSYVTGNYDKSSDIDILIFGSADEKKIFGISKLFDVEINLKIYSKLEKDILIVEVLKNHIFIKNAEIFISEILKWKKSDGV